MQAAELSTDHRFKDQGSEGFAVPKPPQHPAPRWVPQGEVVRAGGLEIAGMVYFGVPSQGGSGAEISLIDPTLQVAAAGDFFRVSLALRASYKALTPTERRGYLTWLAQGRNHPEVDPRLVFLYFYGLERRLTVDVREGRCAPAEIPVLLEELARLSDVYGAREQALATAVESLTYWVQHTECPAALYAQKDPSFRKAYGLRAYTQIAVGQAASAGVPLSAGLARTWAIEAGGSYLRADVRLHRNEFFGLFEDLYTGVHGAGLVLPRTGKPMKLHYSPRSIGLMDHPALARELAGTVEPAEFKDQLAKVKAIFDAASAEVERYAKLAARSPHLLGTLDYLQQLPTRLWPQKTKDAMRALIQHAAEGLRPIEASALVLSIDPDAKFSKAAAEGAQVLLAGVGLAPYPPLLIGGTRAVRADARVVLLPTQLLQAESADTLEVESARVALAAAAVALTADKAIEQHQAEWLEASLDGWHDESLRTSIRLRAALRIVLESPQGLAAIKKDAQALSEQQRKAAGDFAVRAVASTGEPSPAQVKQLAKLLAALGLDGKAVPALLHAAAAGGAPRKVDAPLALDAARIAALQSDTARVAAMLSSIFVDDEREDPPAQAAAAPQAALEDDAKPAATLLGLDEAHSALAAQLLAQPSWSAAEIAAAAAALDLMPAGAIERINEACFDTHDFPFTEGDDPVEINPEILEILR